MAHQRDKEEERIARKWLELQGYTNIKRICRGQPDFVVEGQYAVEVRWLNPLIETDEKIKGEQGRQKTLSRDIKRVLHSFGASIKGRGFSISYEYNYSESPIPPTKVLQQEIRDALQPFRDEILKPGPFPLCSLPRELELECGICLDLSPGNQELSMFSLQGGSDGNACWLLDEARKSLQHSIDEKCRKALEWEKHYPRHEWWLLLIYRNFDMPLQILSQDDWESLRREVQVHKPYSRVFAISFENPEWCYEFNRS